MPPRCSIISSWWWWTSGTSSWPRSAGVQTELALARLRRFRPGLRTLGPLRHAGQPRYRARHAARRRRAMAGRGRADLPGPGAQGAGGGCAHPGDDGALPLVGADRPAAPARGDRAVEEGETALVFTNTRATAEIWFQAMLAARPDWAGIMALHHGSMDRETREWVEDGLREGKLRCVVCTSTLDLGVDFTPVDRVLQVGSPKSVGRLIQRAGRSGHQPGAVSRLTCVPDQRAGAGGRRRGARRARGPRDRGPPAGRAAARPAGAACGDRGAGRRLPRRRAARRGAHHLRLPRPAERTNGAGCSTSSPAAGSALEAYPEYSKVVERRRALSWSPGRWSRCATGCPSAPS